MEIDLIIRNATPAEAKKIFAITDNKRVGNIQNLIGNIWTDPEKDSIRHCNDRNEALTAYRKAFPESTRSKHAVYRQFTNLRDDRQEIPAHKDPEIMTQIEAGKGAPSRDFNEVAKDLGFPEVHPKKESKYQIPFSPRLQKKEYANARNLCIRTGKTYPEAMKDLEKKPVVTMDKIPASQCVAGMTVRQSEGLFDHLGYC